jgi:HEAT repeat protein
MDERELVQRLADNSQRLDAMLALMGAVTATELRHATTRPETFAATVAGLGDPNPKVRWWCVALLDHMPDREITHVVAPLLDDPVPRVRRMAAHALGCTGCRPGCPLSLPTYVVDRLAGLAEGDPNTKVRMEARLALTNLATA